MKKSKNQKQRLYRLIILGVVLVLATVAIAPQIGVLSDSLQTIRHADIGFMIWALMALILSYLTAATTFYLLAIVRIRFWPTVLVEIADGFTNRLLPASLGGVATNLLYLTKQSHTKVKASFVVSVDNLLGFVGHMLLLVCLLMTSPKPVGQLFNWHFPTRTAFWVVVLALGLVVYLAFAHKTLRIIKKTLISFVSVGRGALCRPTWLVLALGSSLATTATYGLMLYFSMLAVNVHVSILQTFLALTVGVIAIAITPTPGGLGGAEAGLTAALTAMGVPAQQALSAALVYRFVTFWVPIIPGFAALQIANAKDYIKTN